MAEVTVFDGAGCIGGNKVHLSFDDGRAGRGLFFDFGMSYSKIGRYYEEFLRPRSNRGIHDLLAMGIVPPLTCYRHDIFPEDVDRSVARRVAVDAVLISHAHMDHVGHASLLDMNIPFACTPMSAAIIKSLRDCNKGDVQYDCPYSSERMRSKGEPRCISSGKRYVGRGLLLPGDCPDGLRKLYASTPSSRREARAANYEAGAIGRIDETGIEVRCFPVDHSIYGAAAYAVNTKAGWVVYSGDLRTHGRNGGETERFAEQARGLDPRLLIVEGTRASREERQESEEIVEENCLRAVSDERGLVVADFGARNVERLEIFRRIASATGRELVILMKDAHLLESMRRADGVDRLDGLRIYDDLRTREDRYQEEVRELHSRRMVDAKEIADSPSSFILSFSFWDLGRMLDIRTDGGTFIYSSSEAYSEEQEIDFRRLSNWLHRLGMRPVGFRMETVAGREVPRKVEGYHASGHISASGVLQLVRDIRPRAVMPIHTEAPELFSCLEDDGIEVIVPEEGRPYRL